METYLILANFTQPGAMNPEAAGAMIMETQKAAEALGLKISSWLMTLGRFDTVLTIQAPNAAAAAKFSMYLAQGGLRTETLRAFSPEEAASFLG